jgi:hypothetical protein
VEIGQPARGGIVAVTGSGGRPDPGQGQRNKKAGRPTLSPSFPAALISHAVWLYHVFSLSFRDVLLLLSERCRPISATAIERLLARENDK